MGYIHAGLAICPGEHFLPRTRRASAIAWPTPLYLLATCRRQRWTRWQAR